MMVLVASCGGTEVPVDPEEILSEAAQTMGELQSFHFEYQVEKPADSEPAQGTEVVAMTGEVSKEGYMRATIDVLQGGMPLQIEFIAAGETHYVKNPITGKWQGVPASNSPVGQLDLGRSTIAILERISHPEYVGTDSVEGRGEAYHLEGDVPAEEIAGVAGAVTTEGPFRGGIWVGTTDSLVHRIEVTGAATNSESPKAKRTILLSGFDLPVTIQPPD